MKKMLLIEDDIILSETYALLISIDFSIEVLVAHNYEEATTLLENSSEFDIVLTDGNIPCGGQMATTQELIQQIVEIFPNVPIVAMSGDDNNEKWMLEAGATFFHTKGNPAPIMKTLSQIIK